MKGFRTYSALGWLLAAIAACILLSCGKEEDFRISGESGVTGGSRGPRNEFQETRRVLLFYESGFNDLTTWLDEDMNKELVKGNVPGGSRNDDVLLVFTKLMNGSSKAPVKSYLKRLYTDKSGNVIADTLVTYPEDVMANTPETMRKVLTYVKEEFPAKGYGLVFSSHGSGWLPEGYFYNPSTFENEHKAVSERKLSPRSMRAPVPTEDVTEDPFHGMTRSIGKEEAAKDGSFEGKEMTTEEFASGIPFHLDYIFFDMCHSAGIEILYALKDKADYVGCSPTEVLSDGMFNYTTITDYLFKTPEADLEGLFKASFDMYDSYAGIYRSSTVMLARTDGLDHLAEVCKEMFEKYRDEIASLDYRKVQGYYRHSLNRHYFFDLEDVFIRCGASDEDLASIRETLDGCTVWKASTPMFMEDFSIGTYSGISIYLPSGGTALLDSYYMQESWNKATELVK